MAHKFDSIARFFDFIFAGGLATLAVLYIILWIPHKGSSLDDWILIGYYIFFALFMVGAVIRYEKQMIYCGFLDSVLYKSVFYIFLASIAFADVTFWACDVFGSIFLIISGLNMMRACGTGSADTAEAPAAESSTSWKGTML